MLLYIYNTVLVSLTRQETNKWSQSAIYVDVSEEEVGLEP